MYKNCLLSLLKILLRIRDINLAVLSFLSLYLTVIRFSV